MKNNPEIEFSSPPAVGWRRLLAGGFAGMNAPFAGHPNDEERARKMYFSALREGATIKDIKEAAKDYLFRQTQDTETISSQIARVEQFVASIKPLKKKYLVDFMGTCF